jgi:hypothetical protein
VVDRQGISTGSWNIKGAGLFHGFAQRTKSYRFPRVHTPENREANPRQDTKSLHEQPFFAFFIMLHTNSRQRIALLSSLMATIILAACGGGEETVASTAADTAMETAKEITPTSAGTWTKVADEWNSFTLGSSQYVRYGSGSNWIGKYVSGTVSCSNSTFGSDPAPGVAKQCQAYSAPTTTSPTPTPSNPGSAALSWTAPAGGVAGYRVYYGTTSQTYSQTKGNGQYVTGTSYTVPSLTSGAKYYFAVTAVDSAGKESVYSTEVTKTIQ